jgi:Na+/phosphate symporter
MLNDITAYLIQCSTHEIGRDNATRIAAMLRVVSEFEEATDRIYRLVKIVQRKYEKGRHLPEAQDQEIITLCAEVRLLLDAAASSLPGVSAALLDKANRIEGRIDKLRKNHNRGSMERMQEGGNVPTEMLFTDINNHALNIIESGERVE